MARRKPLWKLTASERSCRSKHRYESLRVAQQQAEIRSLVAGKKLRAYRCPECKKYHLTSQQEPTHARHNTLPR